MDIIHDWGQIFPASIIFGGKVIVGLNQGKISYSDPSYSSIMKRIIQDYQPDNYSHIPNSNYDIATFIKNKLVEIGYSENSLQIILGQ